VIAQRAFVISAKAEFSHFEALGVSRSTTILSFPRRRESSDFEAF
jgi:hypothetical protein